MEKNYILEKIYLLKTKDKRPTSRCFHTSFIYNNYLYILGGYDSILGVLNDFWKINLTNFKNNDLKWEKIDIELNSIKLFKLKNILIDNKIYLLNYKLNKEGMDIVEINLDNYEIKIIKNNIQNSLELFSINKIDDNFSIIFGGFCNKLKDYLSQIIILEFDNNEFKISEILNEDKEIWPENRNSHCSIIYQDSLIVYGGCNKNKIFSDIWKFQIKEKKWEKILLKYNLQKRYNFGMILFKDDIYIFGGSENISNEYSDLIKLNLKTNNYIKVFETNNEIMKEKRITVRETQKSIKIRNKNTLNKKLFLDEEFQNMIQKKNILENKYKQNLKNKEILLKEFDPNFSLNSVLPQYKIIKELKSKFLNNDIITNYEKTIIHPIDAFTFNCYTNPSNKNYFLIFGGDRNGISNNNFIFFKIS